MRFITDCDLYVIGIAKGSGMLEGLSRASRGRSTATISYSRQVYLEINYNSHLLLAVW